MVIHIDSFCFIVKVILQNYMYICIGILQKNVQHLNRNGNYILVYDILHR